MAENNQTVVRRFFEALWNSGNPEVVDDLMDGNCDGDFFYPPRPALVPSAHEFFKSSVTDSSASRHKEMAKIHPRVVELITKERGNFREVIKRSVAQIREAAPDIRCTIEEMAAEKDMVWTRWSLRSSHKASSGRLAFVFSERKPVTITGVTICRLGEAKIQDYRSYIIFKESRVRLGWWTF